MDQSQLAVATKRFLAVLSPLLAEWSEHFQQFQEGLIKCQPAIIESSLVTLREYQQKFLNLLKVRDQILKHASQAGLVTKTLRELTKHFTPTDASDLTQIIEETETKLHLLHQQLWSMWVISNRSQHSLSHMLEMFTPDSGRRDCYSYKHVHDNHGGLLLDAAI